MWGRGQENELSTRHVRAPLAVEHSGDLSSKWLKVSACTSGWDKIADWVIETTCIGDKMVYRGVRKQISKNTPAGFPLLEVLVWTPPAPEAHPDLGSPPLCTLGVWKGVSICPSPR